MRGILWFLAEDSLPQTAPSKVGGGRGKMCNHRKRLFWSEMAFCSAPFFGLLVAVSFCRESRAHKINEQGQKVVTACRMLVFVCWLAS